VREQIELKNLELFDPVAQDKTGFLLQQSTSNQKMKPTNSTMKGRNCRTKSEDLLLNRGGNKAERVGEQKKQSMPDGSWDRFAPGMTKITR
jgi:hypothetical protein